MGNKILVVDDNQLYRHCVIKSLERQGYKNVIGVETGKEGIEKARAEQPDLVILDVVLPDMNGLEVCRQIKDIEGLKAKVVVITGFIDAADIGKALTAGADHFISKAVDLSSLHKLVKKLLKA